MNLPTARTEGIAIQQVASEVLVYNLTSHQCFLLNESLTRVFQACDGRTTFAELQLRHGLREDEIWLALEELNRQELLEKMIPLPRSVSRRDLLLRMGKGAAALPLLSVLAVPQPSAAASGTNLPFGAACNTSAQCASANPNCLAPTSSTAKRCCVGDLSYYDQGRVVNSCSGANCSQATFACQSDVGRFCCSGAGAASCSSPNSCACRCT